MKTPAYPANILPDEDGRLVVTFPDFGWGATDGATIEEALAEAEDCLAEILATTIKNGEELPDPSEPAVGQVVIYPPTEIATKTMVYMVVKSRKMSNVGLADLMRVHEKEARRILDPYHNTKIPRLEKALRAMGKRLVVSVEDEDGQKQACA